MQTNTEANDEATNKLIAAPVDYKEMFKNLPITEETTCGIWGLKGSFLQRFATKNSYVFIYGFLGCMCGAVGAYFNGTITSIEKRYKIPSKAIGTLSIGGDISQMFGSVLFNYFASKGHRPRWIAFGSYCIVIKCFLNALPHLLYGPGEDALSLTTEYGGISDDNATFEVLEKIKDNILCREDREATCNTDQGSFAPQAIMFLASFVCGFGNSIIYNLGVCYMDDNVEKSMTPAVISLSYFLRLLGPSIGYALASFCLKFYISPTLTPTITNNDPRWLGAWWIGWFVVIIPLAVVATVIGCFPKTLPKTVKRKAIVEAKLASLQSSITEQTPPQLPASFQDMRNTLKRLYTNRIYMINNFATIFYCMGGMAYWIFTAKYIEIQYHQSASVANLVAGTCGLVFSAFGILTAGMVITKWKPRARIMAAWNVVVGVVAVLGFLSFILLGCEANDNNVTLDEFGKLDKMPNCSATCGCDYVQYSPVCSEDNVTTYISACHAGCKDQVAVEDGSKIFTGCSCISNPRNSFLKADVRNIFEFGGTATPGSCKVDCLKEFYMFVAVLCILQFSGSTGRATNFLVSIRCVDEKDKPISMGFDTMLVTLFALMPSPILYGVILDSTCIVWGKTCTGTGNCWLYNGKQLRYVLNLTAAAFIAIGVIFDAGVWYFVKDLKIFDEEDKINTHTNVEDNEMNELVEGKSNFER